MGDPKISSCSAQLRTGKKGEQVMKKYISVILAIGLVLACASIVMAGPNPGSGIAGSLHDLSSNGLGGAAINQTTETRICVFCHTPHFAGKANGTSGHGENTIGNSVNYYPLWNHDLTQVTSYVTYTNGTEQPNSPSMLLDPALLGQPGGVSRLCLSCHDGTVAPNAYGNFEANPTSNAGSGVSIPAGFRIGGGTIGGTTADLSNHHPVGIDYLAAVASGLALLDPSSGVIGGTGLSVNDLLWNNKVECVSCHSVHNKGNEGTKFLWTCDDLNGCLTPVVGSQICLSCHDK
jgi:hypothetical protein